VESQLRTAIFCLFRSCSCIARGGGDGGGDGGGLRTHVNEKGAPFSPFSNGRYRVAKSLAGGKGGLIIISGNNTMLGSSLLSILVRAF